MRSATIEDVIWITGNHDLIALIFCPALRKQNGKHPRLFSGILLNLINGGEVSGHYHPKVRIKTRARRISGRCFVHDGQRLIMPAFGAFTGGLSVFDPAIHDFYKKGGEIIFCHACQVYRYPYSHVIT